MEGKRFIESIRLDNILSYGPNSTPFPLEPLNVLIGPNASGKSNLIEALSLLAAAPRDLQAPIGWGGGTHAWLWKGTAGTQVATIESTIRLPGPPTVPGIPLSYSLSFTEVGWRFALVDEVVERRSQQDAPLIPPYLYYRYRFQGGLPIIDVAAPTEGNRYQRQLQWDDVKPDQSILSQRRDSYTFPELTYLSGIFERMHFYRDWNMGRFAPFRFPQRPDLPQDYLLPDASNLAVLLSNLLNQPAVKERILELMRDFYPTFRDVTATVGSGTVQIFFHEKGLVDAVPAPRLSDGSLRYLCLLAVLCHPNPPPVICIEEPELGLHPDIIPKVAELLVEVSSRSQIFVTTHSDVLVDALTETPEAVIVCEKPDGATQLSRLDPEKLSHWLEKYRLGELWSRGQLGGNRW